RRLGCAGAGSGRPLLARPERAEVDGRVAGPPALHEPRDRRVEHDLLQLVEREEPRAAYRRVLRLDVLERAVGEIRTEDDVHDVPVAAFPGRRDRLRDGDRSFEREGVPQPELLAELAPERRGQRLAAVDAAAGQQPVLTPGLLLPAEEDAVLPAHEHRDAEAGLSHQRAEEPKPRTPRSDCGSSSTSTSSTSGSGRITSCAIRIPGSTTNALCRSVLSRLIFSSPR